MTTFHRPMNLPARKRENTRQRLIDAAADVFLEKGFAGAHIDDVVRRAGFTRGAFYSNYSSIDEIMREVIVVRADQLLDLARDAVATITDPSDISAVMEVLEKLRPEGRKMFIFNVEYRLYQMRHPESEPLPAADRDRFAVLLSSLIGEIFKRMGRSATISLDKLANILGAVFLDWIASSEDDTDLGDEAMGSTEMLATVVEGLVLGLSVPIGDADDNEDAAARAGAPSSSRRDGEHASSVG